MMTDDEGLTNDDIGQEANGVGVKLKKIVRSIVRTLLFMKLNSPVCQITYYHCINDPSPLVFKGIFAQQALPRPWALPRRGYVHCLGIGPINPCTIVEVRDQEDFDSMVIRGTKSYDKLIPLIAYRIFQTIKRRSKERRPYRTLKPQDILLTGPLDPQTSTSNVVAFGLDQLRFSDPLRFERAEVRWYRAPEALFNFHLSSICDMWSAGLILAEVVVQRRLLAGRRDFEQLELTSQYFLRKRASTGQYPQDETSIAIQRLVPTHRLPPRCLKREMLGSDPLLIDLLSRLLVVDYEKRITIDEVFKHPYLANFAETLSAEDEERFQRFWAFPDSHSIRVETDFLKG